MLNGILTTALWYEKALGKLDDKIFKSMVFTESADRSITRIEKMLKKTES